MINKINVWCKIYKLVWSFSPGHLIFLSSLGLVQAVSIVLQLLVIQNFINYVQHNYSEIQLIVFKIIIVGCVLIFRRLYNTYFNYNINKHIIWAKDIIKQDFIKEVSKIPLNEFYKSEFETKKNMAIKGAESSALFLIIALMLLSFNIPYFILIGIYYSLISPIMIFVLLLIIFPSFYSIYKNMKEYSSLEENISNNRKKMDYYYSCIGNINYIKESKILRAGEYFFNKINIEAEEYCTANHKHLKLILKNSLFAELVKFIGYILIFLILIFLAKQGIITIGLLIATITSINDMYSVFNDMVDRDFKSLSSFYNEVRNYIDFCHKDFSYPKTKGNKSGSITFKNVSYKYPNSDICVIQNFDFEFIRGKKYAIVGENGAGKSTLSRLIMGLLPPCVGSISIPENINCPKSNNMFSALFQNYSKYPFSLRDNITLSNSNAHISERKVKSALTKCGLDICDEMVFPNSLDTILSREFKGIELSGGQWQRISLARCIYRDSNFLLLDEPTSAIDPVNEAALFDAFKEISKDKTSIIITHRLGVISIADYILVLDHGQLIEYGTHDELISIDGKYKELYLAQSRDYFE